MGGSDERGDPLWDPQGMPADFTDYAGVFEMRKPRKQENNRRADDAEHWLTLRYILSVASRVI
jgi:hypothetical protein